MWLRSNWFSRLPALRHAHKEEALELFANIVVSGLLTGLIYGLMALGLSAIFGVVRVVNFAHGDMLVVGMYLVLTLSEKAGLHPLFALPFLAFFMFIFGYLLQFWLVDRFLGKSDHVQFLLLLGVAMILTNLCLMLFGPDARSLSVPESFESYNVGFLVIDKVRLLAALTAGICALLLWLFFGKTITGKAIRACADNRLGAQVVGLNVRKLYAITFGVGSASLGGDSSFIIDAG